MLALYRHVFLVGEDRITLVLMLRTLYFRHNCCIRRIRITVQNAVVIYTLHTNITSENANAKRA